MEALTADLPSVLGVRREQVVDEEEASGDALLAEQRRRLLELVPKPVVEGDHELAAANLALAQPPDGLRERDGLEFAPEERDLPGEAAQLVGEDVVVVDNPNARRRLAAPGAQDTKPATAERRAEAKGRRARAVELGGPLGEGHARAPASGCTRRVRSPSRQRPSMTSAYNCGPSSSRPAR